MRRTALLLMFCSLLISARSRAAGFYAGEVSTRGLGRAGADVVNPADGFALWRNPAALANQSGLTFTLSGNLSQLNLEFERSGPFDLPSYQRDVQGHRLSGSPHVAVDPSDIRLNPGDDWRDYVNTDPVSNKASPMVLDCSDVLATGLDGRGHCPIMEAVVTVGDSVLPVKGLTLALGIFGPPTGGYWFWDENLAMDPSLPEDQRYLDEHGLDRRYTGAQRYTLIDREITEAFAIAGVSYRMNRYLGLGLGLQGVTHAMRMRIAVSADTYGTEDPYKDLVINIDAAGSWQPSANVGFWSNPIAGLEIGGSMQLPRHVRLQGPVSVDYTAPGLTDYVISDSNAVATITFDMPAIYRLGALYRWAPWFDIEAAVVYEQWSSWSLTRVAVDGLTFAVPGLPAVEVKPMYQPKVNVDTWSIRIGGDVDPLATIWPQHLWLRAGYMYETSAVPNETLDVSLWDSNKHVLACGAEFAYAGARLRFAYQHNFYADVVVDNSIAAALAPVGDVFGYETRTAVGNGTYRGSMDIVSLALAVDTSAVYDAIFAPSPAL